MPWSYTYTGRGGAVARKLRADLSSLPQSGGLTTRMQMIALWGAITLLEAAPDLGYSVRMFGSAYVSKESSTAEVDVRGSDLKIDIAPFHMID